MNEKALLNISRANVRRINRNSQRIRNSEPSIEQDKPEPDCECIQTDVDYYDNRYCPAHGPNSEAARRQRKAEADDEAAAAARIPFLIGEDWSDDTI
jgi:hypothetical protein